MQKDIVYVGRVNTLGGIIRIRVCEEGTSRWGGSFVLVHVRRVHPGQGEYPSVCVCVWGGALFVPVCLGRVGDYLYLCMK